MRRAAAILIRIPWLIGLIAGTVLSLLRWGWEAAADGAQLSGRWQISPVIGMVLAGSIIWMVVWLIF